MQTEDRHMSFLDRLLGRGPSQQRVPVNTLRTSARPADPDAAAVERYRYLLRTAPPEDLERAHAEAFERLTPEQRDMAREELAAAIPPAEAPRSSEPRDLARSATRAEMREPGTLDRAFGRSPAAPGMAGSFMHTFAAVFVGTTMAQALFGGLGDPGAGDPGTAEAGAGAEGWEGGETADAGFGDGGDVGAFDDFGGFDI
jgi:hypothetical protein